MLKNYLKIFIRNLRKNPVFILINILGLSVGMAVSMLIFLFVQHELSYDGYHENKDRIFRVSRAFSTPDGDTNLHLGHTAPPFGPLLKSDFVGQVAESVRVMNVNVVVKEGAKIVEEERFFFSDPEVFRVFSWNVIDGDPDSALTYPDGLVISETLAYKYFGEEDPMGQSFTIMIGSEKFEMSVRGIMEDVPDNSHFKPEILASMEPVVAYYGGYESMMKDFGGNNFGTYLKLEPDVDYKEFESQLPDFINRHLPAGSQGLSAASGTRLHLWPITDIHLFSNLDSEIAPNSSMENVYIYSAIAVFILLIACINFMNLATARSAKRAMEVGLRKVMGADRQLLVKQFMSETILMSLIAMIIALFIAVIALPLFENFTGKLFSTNFWEHPEYIIGLTALVLIVGLISGSYPSLFLSGFQPVKVLKGTFKIGSVHEKLRSILVVGQFAISILLIVAVLIVVDQLDFMKNKELGFEKDEIVVLPAYDEFISNFEIMRERLLQQRGIKEVALGSRIPSGRLLDAQGTKAEVNGELSPMDIRVSDIHVSHSFIRTFGMQIQAGRDFDVELASDSTQAFILNEAAVRAIGWSSPKEAIDKQLHYGIRRGYVVGVVKDFHFESLHQPISPMVFLIPTDRINEIAIKVDKADFDATIAYLNEEWRAIRPDFPFNYYTVAGRFDQQYEAEEKVGALFGFFAGLAIIISVLGLFGLSAYATEQRTKEIGIRKVMGASIWNIVALLGIDFLKLVFAGFVIATPIAWWLMSHWLGNFAYSISISWIVFLIAGLGATLVAALSVSSQSLRAAMINPVDAFKVE
ncbi:ABC transporter permease [Pleomorphovibrio marinus]|uniref:ABC transporter permease n=1 Tax=Pleomorphovibrio marinus TaxID=2164132 RepID=UPI000E0B25AF|nr:ABC transporter permease [Pleomorphovibrio marinus]